MATQSIILTAVPKGVVGTPEGIAGRVLVHVAPRLLTPGTVADYADFVDWPATILAKRWEVVFPLLGFTAPGTVVGTLPDSLRWTALFPSATPVEAHAFKGYDHRRLYSYPVKGIVDFLRERWGKFGANDPLDAPLYADLMEDDEGFGPIAFELLGRRPTGQETGPERKARLLSDVRDDLDPASNDPNKWAFPYVDALPASQPAKADAIGRRFLQAEWFHYRGRREEWESNPPPTPPAVFEPDFHKIVTLVARYPKLIRLLGLVFELQFPLARTLGSPDTQVQVRLGAGDALALAHQPVSSRTHCKVGGTPTDFDAIYNTPQDPMAGDYLALGDTAAYLVSEVDPDGGAIKALQFADNVSRSRRELNPDSKRTFYTPDRFHLPAHSSSGLMVSRLGRASRQAKLFNRAQLMNAAAFDAVGAPIPGAEPELWAEDLIRGWRFDIKPGPGTKWRSLQGVTGTYHLVNNGAADVPVDFNDPNDREEAIIVGGATSRGGPNDNDDLYMGENVAQWTGWSLASKLLGLSIGPDDEVMEPDANPTDPDFGIKAALGVAPGSLPPLRFGREYFVRARSVDLGFQGPRFDPDLDPVEPGAVSPATVYHRYEPVQPPDILLRDPLDGPGDSTRVIVIRSEDAADNAFKETFRHALPPRNSVQLAEHHGLLDASPGVPDPALYPVIAARDAENLATHPDGVLVDPSDPSGERNFPVAHVALNYLADPLAQQALVRGLPLTGSGTEALLPFRTNSYPDWDTFTIHLFSAAASSFTAAAPVLDVALDKAWDIDVLVSCVFDDDHLLNDELGVWPWIQAWVAQHGGPFTVSQLRNLIIQGKHWMFTPSRRLRLVHAVRTPLAAPDGSELQVQRPNVGLTFADASRFVDIHRRSTGRVDLFGKWSMKIDTGLPDDDPTVPHDFEATAFSVDVDHRSGEPEKIEFQGNHEFGDMKHRFVDYQLIATTPFQEFYKETTTVAIPSLPATTAQIGQAVEIETIVVKDVTVDPPLQFRRGEDFTVDETGLLTLPAGSSIPRPGQVEVSFVAPEIHNTSIVYPKNIFSSARPTAPKIEYVVPAFQWGGTGTTTPSVRQGNTLRVYMQRPWWSTGDDEQLAVIVWRGGNLFQIDPPERLKPLVTRFGFDPVYKSDVTAVRPTRDSFPLGTPVDGTTVDNSGVGLTLLETGDVVDIAAHNVGFDEERDLWYCDIAVDPGNNKHSYMPFVRLALARYQPHSLPGVHLSRVALADFIQLSPDRAVSVIGSSPTSRTVTVLGRGYTATEFRNQPAVVRVTVELARAGVTDPNLKWATAAVRNFNPVTTLTPNVALGNFVTWSGTVALPNTAAAKRLVIEEIELHREGHEYIANNPNLAGTSERVVFTDTITIS